MNSQDDRHERVRVWMEDVREELCTTPLVLAELDYLAPKQGGSAAARALHEDFEEGAYSVEWWRSALRETIATARLYESIDLGLTDASLIALAAHLETIKIATLDERHFRAARPLAGTADSFTLLPAEDA